MSQKTPPFDLKLPYLALLAVLLETTGMFLLSPESWDLGRQLLIMSGFALALVFAWANRGWRPMQVLAIGLLMNLAAMLANGGLMPVTPENAILAGFADEVADLKPGDPVPRSKDILKERGDTALAPLTDVIVLPAWFPGRAVASPGDAVVAIAVILAAFSAATAAAKAVRRRESSSDTPVLPASGRTGRAPGGIDAR
ncbi:MAG TPA: DUF5317 family protein [Dehalococcoidia bacterium]|nr:DUF5317 family protein [Dehalococcoidia bacterium]